MRRIRVGQVISMVRLLRLVIRKRPVGYSCVVAEADGAIVGYACLNAVPGGMGDVQMIAVEPDRQGQGTGPALLLSLMNTAEDRGCHSASLCPGRQFRARRLYQRMGFIEVGTLPGYYRPSGTDALMMRAEFQDPRPTHASAWPG